MTLKQLLSSNPSWPASLSNAQALAWLKETITVETSIGFIDLWEWGAMTGAYRKIGNEQRAIDANTSTLTPPQQNDIRAMWVLMSTGGNWELDLSRVELRSTVNRITGAGVPLTPSDRDALFAKSDKSVKRWTRQKQYPGDGVNPNGMDDVSWLDAIERARA